MRDPQLTRAIELAGGARAVAAAFGISRQAVHRWRRVPSARVLPLCALTGDKVQPHELRPDLYPAPAAVAAIA